MPYQVLFFGTSQVSIPTLEALTTSEEIELKAVITQPDKPVGRKQELTPPPVKIYAEKKEIPVLQPEKVRGNEEFLSFVQNAKPDFIVVISYGNILPQEILQTARYGAFNIHTSLLPKYRGASPIQQALKNGDETTGISIIKMNEKMDEGDIIMLKKVVIEPEDNYESLEKKLAITGAQLIVPVLQDFAEGALKPMKQDHAKATYCQKIQKEDGKINWSEETAEEISNKIRAFSLWPKTYTTWQGKKVIIAKARHQEKSGEKPGTLTINEQNELEVACKSGALIPLTIQIEGKKEMPVAEFLKGYKKKIEEESFFN